MTCRVANHALGRSELTMPENRCQLTMLQGSRDINVLGRATHASLSCLIRSRSERRPWEIQGWPWADATGRISFVGGCGS